MIKKGLENLHISSFHLYAGKEVSWHDGLVDADYQGKNISGTC